MKSLFVLTLLLAVPFTALEAQSQPWVSAYYAGWMQSYLPPSAIDYSAVTHIIHFSVAPSGANVNGSGNGITPASSAAIVQAAHAAGKKVLVTCGGWGDDAAFVTATNATNRTAFVNNIVQFILANGYDGIDIDWEPITSPSQFKLFIPELRAALDAARPGLLLTIASMGGDHATISSVASAFDQINIMTYDMSGAWQGWVVWHNAPIYDGGLKFPGTNKLVPSANGDIDSYVAAGIPKSKLGIGADFYGYVWSGVTRPGQSWTSTPSVTSNVPYYQLMSTYGSTPAEWDSAAQAAFISVPTGTGKFVSLDNEQTMFAKAAYVKNKGIGGMIIWELGGGYQASAPAGQRDRLLKAVKAAFAGGTPPSADTIKPAVAIVVPQKGATVSGTITLSASATDNIGVVGVQFAVDGVNAGAEMTGSSYSIPLNTWQYANGTHILSATARDFAGNRARDSVTVTVQNIGVPPVTPDQVVYDDALQSPFRDASWSAVSNYQNTSPVLSGSRSVKVDFSSYGAFDVLSGTWSREIPIDITKYDTLRFSIYPVTQFSLTVGFYVGTEVLITPPAGKWTTFAIPLPREAFSRFYVVSEVTGARTAYFDAVRFTGGVAKTSSVAGPGEAIPLRTTLAPNFPNPFNPGTEIGFQLAEQGPVRLAVFDLLGREIAVLLNEQKTPGIYTVRFDAGGLASGAYYYRLTAGSTVETRKMILAR